MSAATPGSESAAWLRRMAPGVVASIVVAAAAVALGQMEETVIGRPVIEPIVLAILLGMAVRPFIRVTSLEPGLRVVAKDVLEVAVMLLGATMDVPRLFASGPLLAVGIVALVTVALAFGRLEEYTSEIQ